MTRMIMMNADIPIFEESYIILTNPRHLRSIL